jgi:catechol 2,3-dioxygenase-like lactoylglutathione lyase family enzyme
MSNNQAHNEATREAPKARGVDMKLEVSVLSVSDVDRAKRFYEELGWRLDADFVRNDGSRAVQLTPPGSPCSIHLGDKPLHFLIVSDIEAARAELAAHGVAVSGVFHRGEEGRIEGADPERRSYGSLATFGDPDGNAWLIQEVTARLPGRVDTDVAAFTSPAEIAAALERAARAHGEHEKREGGQRDENWPAWYAEYIFAEQTGKKLPE